MQKTQGEPYVAAIRVSDGRVCPWDARWKQILIAKGGYTPITAKERDEFASTGKIEGVTTNNLRGGNRITEAEVIAAHNVINPVPNPNDALMSADGVKQVEPPYEAMQTEQLLWVLCRDHGLLFPELIPSKQDLLDYYAQYEKESVVEVMVLKPANTVTEDGEEVNAVEIEDRGALGEEAMVEAVTEAVARAEAQAGEDEAEQGGDASTPEEEGPHQGMQGVPNFFDTKSGDED